MPVSHVDDDINLSKIKNPINPDAGMKFVITTVQVCGRCTVAAKLKHCESHRS